MFIKPTRSIVAFLGILMFLCLPELGLGQNRSAQEEGKNLLRQSAEACGGAEAFARLFNMTMRGKITIFDGGTADFADVESIGVLPDQYITTLFAEGVKASEALDRDRAFLIPPNAERQSLGRNDMKRIKMQFWLNVGFLFAQLKNGNFTAEFMGNSTLENQEVKVVRLQPNGDLPSFNVYLNTQSKLPMHFVFSLPTDKGMQNGILVLEDYREIGGVKLPYKVSLFSNQIKMQETQYNLIIVNDDLDRNFLNGKME